MSEQLAQTLLAHGPLVSLVEAAELTPYSAEYLSLLARKGRLVAVKLGRDWLTTESAVKHYVKEQERKHARILTILSKAARREGYASA